MAAPARIPTLRGKVNWSIGPRLTADRPGAPVATSVPPDPDRCILAANHPCTHIDLSIWLPGSRRREMKAHSNLTKGLPVFPVVLCVFIAGCRHPSEAEKRRAEDDRLKEEAEAQGLKKQAEPVGDCALKGSVAVVGKDGTRCGLGLVSIAISDPDKIKQHLEETFNTLAARCREDRKTYDALAAGLSDLVNKMQPCLVSFERAQTAFARTLNALPATANVYATLHRVDMRNGADRGQYQVAAGAFRDALSERAKAAIELKPQLAQVRAQHLEAAKMRSRILSVIDGQMDAVFVRLPRFEVLKAGANGEFHATLPRNKKVTIAARAEKSVGKEAEHHYWLTEFTVPDKDEATILLDNDTLLDGIPEYSDRLSGFLPNVEPEVPSIDIEDALSAWVFTPSLPAPRMQSALQPGGGAVRSGNVIFLGTRLSAEILDEGGTVVGAEAMDAGGKLEIEGEDERYVFFKHNGRSCRLRKDKLPKQGPGG